MGLAGAAWLTEFTRTLLFQIAPTDPVSFVVPTAAGAIAAIPAAVIPMRRAARVDPAVVLRAE